MAGATWDGAREAHERASRRVAEANRQALAESFAVYVTSGYANADAIMGANGRCARAKAHGEIDARVARLLAQQPAWDRYYREVEGC